MDYCRSCKFLASKLPLLANFSFLVPNTCIKEKEPSLGNTRNTIDTSPFNIVGIPSSNPNKILLLPKTCLIGIPLPVM